MFELYEVTHVLIIQCDPLNFLLKQLLQTYALFSCQLVFQDLVLNAVDFTRENVQKVNKENVFFKEIQIIISLFSN